LTGILRYDIVRGLGGGWSQEQITILGRRSKGYEKIVQNVLKSRKAPTSLPLIISGKKNPSLGKELPQENLAGSGYSVRESDAHRKEWDELEEYLDMVQILSILLIPVLA
jgi:hypothetical protein